MGARLAVVARVPAVVALVAASLVLIAPVLAPTTAVADTTQAGCAGADPFTAGLAAQLAQQWPGKHFSAQVYDERSGCQFDLHPELRLTTASVLKVEVMAGILLRAQSQGRPLSAQERSLIEPMITASHDAPTTALWQSLGGAPGMTNLDHVFGMTGTTQIGPEWGVTITSAADQVRLLRQVVVGDFGPVGPSYRADAFHYMSSVIPSQRWGISAGLPANWTFVNKNGFAGSNCCAWRINSTGVVYSPDGPAYTIAILSDGWPDQPSGVAAVETVSRAVAAKLAVPVGTRLAVGLNRSGTLVAFAATATGRVLAA
ncbi:MAG: serine hydrolase, partial [Actinomycetota bacterium]|nr:serine hydrolase [Actinomycetota bacterium]